MEGGGEEEEPINRSREKKSIGSARAPSQGSVRAGGGTFPPPPLVFSSSTHPPHPGAYYLTECDSLGRRAYHLVRDPEMRLRGPTLITIQKPEGGWALDDEAQQAGEGQQAEEGQDAGEGVVAPTAPSRV
eukprot:scaffold5104_cov123-Isochrysis_galbana.AAC.3